ncbi:ATP-binding protein [Sphingorhabdus sp. M41]|uniref:ATP-binding protein n=1 Tax=Sphingorhabdus sp. M41 TaxID=1806885 RepID=UPI00078C4CA4|nr:ATP-binding protein [Sphingorhabdus sp. M41]AMO72329.1 hypothetical protein AZE99_11120 [Sphingorhabdus sp. M41]
MNNAENILPKLQLPRRWEFLEQKAKIAEIDPSQIVERVESAAKQVDSLLRRVRTGGGGLIEVFYGLSGSGKTTFLKTLPRFFEQIRVKSFPSDRPIRDLPRFVEQNHLAEDRKQRIILIEKRDNPKPSDLDEVEEMFADLLETFRIPEGQVLVIWPITDDEKATQVAQTAWQIGRDSMVDAKSRGRFHFKGVPSEKYFDLADNTSRTLTGDGLEAFGITRAAANEIIPNCQTISDYFAELDEIADETRDSTWSVLKEKVRARLWVVLPGDDLKAVNATASALTQGTRNKVDIDLIGEFIDQPGNDSIYVKEWRERRTSLAHLLRAIDVRLFPLPPNVCLAAIRSMGSPDVKGQLKQPSTNREGAKKAIRASRLYKAILTEVNVPNTPFKSSGKFVQETADEYQRIQALASSNDKPLNKAVGGLLAECLAEDASTLVVTSEKQSLPNSSLKPDILIKIGENDFICLEPTWRTTGVGIKGEMVATQNTLTEAHIKKYVLDKATQFVTDLGI